MKTLILPDHTLHRLVTVGTALHLSPMEPKIPYFKINEWFGPREGRDYWTGFVWAGDGSYETSPVYSPHKSGDVVAVAEPFYVSNLDDWTKQVNPQLIYASTPELWVEKSDPGVAKQCTYLDGTLVSREAAAKNLENHRHQRLHPAHEMPSWAARHHARCLSVAPLRLAELSEEQARETGIDPARCVSLDWQAWVWAIRFEVVK